MWLKPYTIKRKRGYLFWPVIYMIQFEECTMHETSDHDEAKMLLGYLNGAYNLGYQQRQRDEEDEGRELSSVKALCE